MINLAIIHYPVYNKRGDIVATSISNLELHDVARCCMTYGVQLCYIVTPLPRQRQIADSLIDHWTRGYGTVYNPDRAEALRLLRTAESIDEMMAQVRSEGEPLVIGTSSRSRANAIGYPELKKWVAHEDRPFLLLFGTGWGLPPEVIERCDRMLEPVSGKGAYNHLSLRVAIGIVLDRILGDRGGEK
jgi:hypothetical protein